MDKNSKYSYRTVLALIGKSKIGKTNILLKLISIIKERQPELKETISSKPRKQRKESTFVFTIKDKLYMITTIGDGVKYIEQELNFVENNYGVKIKDIDYFVCAGHRGDLADILADNSKACYFHNAYFVENGKTSELIYDNEMQYIQAEMLYKFMIKIGAFNQSN